MERSSRALRSATSPSTSRECRQKKARTRYLFGAIDRPSKFAYTELHEPSDRKIATAFLQGLIAAVPYTIHTVLPDNGSQFYHAPRYRHGPTAQYVRHMFGRACDRHRIEHRLTQPQHPWTNGPVERMNRTIKDATVKRYDDASQGLFTAHLHSFLMAYNVGRRLKPLKGLTPYESVCKRWTTERARFIANPFQHTAGLNT